MSNIKIKLVHSKDAFCVMSQADCKVMITKAAMFVRKVKLSLSVFLVVSVVVSINGNAFVSAVQIFSVPENSVL